MRDPPPGECSGNSMNNRTASRAKNFKLDEDSTSLLANADPDHAYDGIGFRDEPHDDGDNDDDKHTITGSADAADSFGLITAVVDTMYKPAFNTCFTTKAYARLILPSLPASDGMDSWMRTMKWFCARAGEAFADGLEAAWLDECSSSSFVQLSSPLWGNLPSLQSLHDRPERWRKLDFAVAQTLDYSIQQSQESAAKAVLFRKREHEKSNSTLRGRQLIWIILDHFWADRESVRQPWLPQPPVDLVTDSCRLSAARARPKGKGEGRNQCTTSIRPVPPAPQVSASYQLMGFAGRLLDGESAGPEVVLYSMHLLSNGWWQSAKAWRQSSCQLPPNLL